MSEKKKTSDDSGYLTGSPLYRELLRMEEARVIYAYGDPGVGKTHDAYHVGRTNKGVYALTMMEDTPAPELRGHYIPKDNGMVWVDGPLIEAMRKGARLVVNEVSHSSPEALTMLHPVLESKSTARLTLPTNETVHAQDGFHVILTDNHPPEELPEALRDRFEFQVHITDPAPEVFKLLDDDLAWAARRTIHCKERRIGLRSWLAIQRVRAKLGTKQAFISVLGEERAERVYTDLKLADRLED